MLRKKLALIGFAACALSCCVYADESEQLFSQSEDKILTVCPQLESTEDEEANIALDQETCVDPEDVVRHHKTLYEENDFADRGGREDLLIAKTCAEGKCPSEMIERLREQKRRERGEIIEKENTFENLEIPDENERKITA